MSRYIASGVREARPGTISAEDYQFPLYIEGTPEAGFRPSLSPPRVGYWGITAATKQNLAATVEPGNVATWLANGAVSLTGGDQRFVSLGAANLMERQLGLDTMPAESGWRYLSNTLSPIRNVSNIDQRLLFEDDDFDAQTETSSWLESNRALASTAARYGVDLPEQLRQARNRDHFVFLQNRALMQAQALQDIETFEDQSYGITEFASMMQSAVQNYLLTDPTFLPSLFIPLGPGGQMVKVSGQSVLRGVAPAALTKPQNLMRLAGPVLGPLASPVAQGSAKIGNAVSRAPAAIHGALSVAVGHRAARAVELGVYGGAFSTASQFGRISQSKVIFDDPELQDTYSWAELGLTVGASALLGFALAGKAARGRQDPKQTMAAVVESQGHRAEAQPIVESLDYVRAQALIDNASVRVQRSAEILMPGRSWVIGEYLDDALLSEAGMTRLDMEDLLVSMVEGFKGRTFDENGVRAVLNAALTDARRVSSFSDEIASMGSQVERSAYSEALGRAAQELGVLATADQITARAQEILPGVLNRLDDRARRIADGVGPQKADSAKYWLREWAELARSAELRSLTRDEMRYLMKVEGALKRLQSQGVEVKFFSVFDEVAASRGRYSQPRIQPAASDPLLRSLRETRRLRREIEAATKAEMAEGTLRAYRTQLAREIRNLRSLTQAAPGPERQTLREAIQTTNEILAEAAEAQNLVPRARPTGQTLEEVQSKWAANPPVTDAQKTQAYLEVLSSRNLSDTTLIEDVGARNKILFGWGLGKALKRLIGSGPGLSETARSSFDAVRMVAQELDPNRLTVGDLSGRAAVKTVQSIRNDMESATAEIVGEVARLAGAGKFGSQINFFGRRQKMAEFNKAVIRHVQKIGTPSQDPDVIRVGALWKKHADLVRKAAEAMDEFSGVDNFFPRRFHLHRIMREPEKFITSLGRHHGDYWRGKDVAHMDTLVRMGKLTRKDSGGKARWFNEANEEIKENSIKRSNLSDYGVTEEKYLEELVEATKDSARRSRARLFGEDAYVEAAEGGVVRVSSENVALSSTHREIDDAVWASDFMEEFLDWNFLGGVHDYLRTTGVRVLNKQRHQQQWGIPGGSMEDLLNAVKAAAPEGLEPDELVRWRSGVENLREKMALAEGRLPSVRSSSDRVAEWLSETGQALSTASFGSMIGGAVLSTEVLQTFLRGIYSPRDIVRKAGEVFKVAVRTGEVKDLMQTVGLTVRQYRYHSMERFSGGAVDMDSFQFGFVPKVLGPFVDVFSRGGANLPGQGNRTAGFFRALGGLGMTVGGMDYFSQFARMMQVMDAQAEAGRFINAAQKLGVLLRDNAKELRRIREVDGDAAYFKKWRGLTRTAGFGSQWQVAEKFAMAGLLDPARMDVILEAGRATGAIRPGRVVDLSTLMQHVPADADAARLFDEGVTGMRDVMVGVMNKRISEQSLIQTPTNANARSAWGQLVLTMTGFSRSWADNNLMDVAQMPTRTASAMLATYLFGETMNRMSRDLMSGRSIDDIMLDIEEDPDNFIARTMTNVPVAGQWTFFVRNGLEALTRNERMQTSDPVTSAGFGALSSTQDTILNAVQAASPLTGESELQSNTLRHAGRLLPIYNTWWFGALNDLSSASFGTPDLKAPVKKGHTRVRGYDVGPVELPSFLDETPDMGPDFSDIGFQIPEGDS